MDKEMAVKTYGDTMVEYYIAIRPFNNDQYSGDTGIIREYDNKIFAGIIDGAGHGIDAYKVADKCKEYLEANYQKDLNEIIEGIHKHIHGDRGAVLCLCLIDKVSGEMKISGMGNITARKFGSVNERFVLREGIVGYMMSSPREKTIRLTRGDVIVLYSDGVRESFEADDYPDLLKDDAKSIALNMIDMFGKDHDDASCIALKYISQEMED